MDTAKIKEEIASLLARLRPSVRGTTEHLLTGNAEVDEHGRQISRHCLGLPPILRHMLGYFSDSELLKLSLVNKQWNYEARSVLRDRASLTASIRSDHSCQRIKEFAADLEEMGVVPFSGIQLVLSPQTSVSLPNESLDESYKTILQRLPCRRFSLHFDDAWENPTSTPALGLVGKILKDYSGVLEELSLDFDWEQVQLPQQFVQDHNFVRLKTLKVAGVPTVDESLTHFLKVLVSRAPNLEELNIRRGLYFNENILEGSSAVLVPFASFHPLYEQVCESLVGALRPKYIQMIARHSSDEHLELLNRRIPMILQASRPTVFKLHVDLLFLVPLMCYGICFENVFLLCIRVGDNLLPQNLQPRVSKLVKLFDFARIFPGLSRVDFESCSTSSLTPEHVSGFVEQGHAVLGDPLRDRVVKIKEVTLYGTFLDSTVAFFSQMFPGAGFQTISRP